MLPTVFRRLYARLAAPKPSARWAPFILAAVACTNGAKQVEQRAVQVPTAPAQVQIPVPHIPTDFAQLPGPAQLASSPALPPVLQLQRGGGVWSEERWRERRQEMKAILEHYAVGHAPPPPGNVQGRLVESRKLNGGKVDYRLVRLSFGPARALELDIGVFTPAGAGRVPAVIAPAGSPPGAAVLPRLPQGPGQGKGVDALLRVGADATPTPGLAPPALDAEQIAQSNPALQHGFAYVVFNHNDCGEDTTLRAQDGSWAFRSTRFYPAYPGYDWGLLGGWAWGMSRIVDYLQTDAAVDPERLIVTGFSRLGKAALVAGAFDDRIALTAPVATGGGGLGVYRHSGAGRGGKEGLDLMLRKYPNWFSPHLHAFSGHTDRLPFDQHWLVALVAPRALIALEGEEDSVSLENAVKQSLLGAKPAFAFLGVPDRLGVNYLHRAHAFTAEDWQALLAFADRHLMGLEGKRRFDRFPSDLQPQAAASPSRERVQLWNGKDLQGWTVYLEDGQIDPASTWSQQGDILRLDAPVKGYIRTESSYSDYHLHLEWRWPEQPAPLPNSGVMFHLHGPDVIWPACYECQLKHHNAGQLVGMGLTIASAPLLNKRRRSSRFASISERPRGEWNSYDIYCRGDTVDAFVNGVRQNYAEKLAVSSGAIALQMEGFPIEFRAVWLEPLE